MKYGMNTLDDFCMQGKTVICRVDINEPIDRSTGKLQDTTRIERCIPTIIELSEKKAKVVLLAHQGGDLEYKNYYTTEPHADVIRKLSGKQIDFVDDVVGPEARKRIANLKEGEIILLDNVRFVAEEMTQFETKLKLSEAEQAKTQVVAKLAPLADLYVCDAFAAVHRSQPSLVGFEQVLPAAMGRLFEKEVEVLTELMQKPARPCLFVLGGAKIQDAFIMMSSVLEAKIADTVITGGLVANIMLWAKGIDIGQLSRDFIMKKNLGEYIEVARKIIEKFGDKVVLPVDLAYVDSGRQEVCLDDLPVSDFALVDIGSRTTAMYEKLIAEAQTIFVNGPFGIFEKAESEYGTKQTWNALAKSKAFTVVGGGDSISALNKYNLGAKISYICTAGGGLVRFLTGEELPVIKALRHSAIPRTPA